MFYNELIENYGYTSFRRRNDASGQEVSIFGSQNTVGFQLVDGPIRARKGLAEKDYGVGGGSDVRVLSQLVFRKFP